MNNYRLMYVQLWLDEDGDGELSEFEIYKGKLRQLRLGTVKPLSAKYKYFFGQCTADHGITCKPKAQFMVLASERSYLDPIVVNILTTIYVTISTVQKYTQLLKLECYICY